MSIPKLNDAQRLTGLIELAGHYQDGSDQQVRFTCDDATQEYAVVIGSNTAFTSAKRFWAGDRRTAIDLAIASNPDALAQALGCAAAVPVSRYQSIIASMYQIAAAYDMPIAILDILSDPVAATDQQINTMRQDSGTLAPDFGKPDPDGERFRMLLDLIALDGREPETLTEKEAAALEIMENLDEADTDAEERTIFIKGIDTIIAQGLLKK